MLRNPFARQVPVPERDAYLRLASKGYRPAGIIDVGAYEGNWTRLARQCFPGVPVLMCEAQPGKQPLLDAVCRELPDVTCVSALLSAQSGDTVEFSEMETGSSIYPENSNVNRLVRQLTTSTLDEVASGIPGPCFLKIDVQGAELDVLSGGARVLERCDLVQLEVAVQDYNKGAPAFLDVLTWMDARNFVPHDISGWSRPNGVDLVQIDLLFVPRDSALRPRSFEF